MLKYLLFFMIMPTALIAIPLIDRIVINQNGMMIEVHDSFKKKYLTSNFFVYYQDDINLEKLDSSLLIAAFLLNVITIIWASGETYTIPALDRDLWFSLEKVKKVFKKMYPHTRWDGSVVPERLVKHDFNLDADGVAHMFSNGLDSICSSLLHKDDKQLLITVQGHPDTPINDQKIWKKIQNESCVYAQEYGFNNTFLCSNYYHILKRSALHKLSPEISHWRTAAVEGLGWIGLAIPLLICKGYNHLRIASSISWDCPFVHAANPFVDNNIKCAGISVEHDGFEYSRVQKCKVLKECVQKYNIKKPHLRVCAASTDATNCCVCLKCIQTIHGLWAVGENHQEYGFDLDTQKVIAATKNTLAKKYSRFKLWHFECIQQLLRDRVINGETLSPYLNGFLQYDFSQHTKKELKQHPRVNWKSFVDFLN